MLSTGEQMTTSQRARLGHGWLIAIIACTALSATPVHAGLGEMTGFLAAQTGTFNGRVTELSGAPAQRVTVHVVTSSGEERLAATDDLGRYRVEVKAGDYVYVKARVRLTIQTAAAQPGDSGEVVVIHDVSTPARDPRLIGDLRYVPPYSEAASNRNEWARAWLMLDISAAGQVERVQLLNPAGHGLDEIAVKEAWKLRFEPARDTGNHAIGSLVAWSFEWPAYFWLSSHRTGLRRLPDDTGNVACRGDGAHSLYRDCSPPDFTKVTTAPWIDRPRP